MQGIMRKKLGNKKGGMENQKNKGNLNGLRSSNGPNDPISFSKKFAGLRDWIGTDPHAHLLRQDGELGADVPVAAAGATLM